MSLGTILLIVLVLMLVGVVPVWPHARSWGYGPSGIVGVILVIVLILFLMTWFPEHSLMVAYVLVFGLCQGARGPIISSMSARLFPGSQTASIYGVLYACNAIGAGTGALLAGLLHDLSGSYRPGFVMSVCALLLAVLPFWRVPELRDFRLPRSP